MLRENSNWNEMFKDLLKWSFKTSTCNYLAYITYPRQTWTCTWTQYTHTQNTSQKKPECNERILKWFDDDDWKANSPLSLSFFFTQSHTHARAGTHTYTDRATVLSRTCFTRFASAVPSDKCHKHWHQGETWRSIKLLSWLLRFEYFNFCCPWMQSSPSTNTSPCQPNVFSWTVTLFSYYLLMLGANLKKSSCDPSLKTHL